MNFNDLLFWNNDTQFDFISPNGKLYVPGAELLKPNWAKLTQLAKNKSISVINTADWHNPSSAEISQNPDYINTFPLHCMANTEGAEYIEETSPENSLIIDWDREITLNSMIVNRRIFRNYTIRKDVFDVFKGNPFTDEILNILSPKTVIVYGVTTNVCVNDAVMGLVKRVDKVIVVQDAIKELPNLPLPFTNWKNSGVELMKLCEIETFFQS